MMHARSFLQARCHSDLVNWKNAASFSTIFEIHADLSAATKDVVRQKTASGEIYYELQFDAIVYFGLTEIRAEVGWQTKVCVKSYVLQSTDSVVIPER